MKVKENFLEKLYTEAVYAVFWNKMEIRFKVGEISDEINRILEVENARNFAFLTAYNPFSKQLSEAENKVRQTELIKLLQSDNFLFYTGYGTNENESWEREESLFILNIEEKKAVEFACFFNQNAIVFGRKREESKLVWCS